MDYDAVTDIATARFGMVTAKNIIHADMAKYHLGYDLTGTGFWPARPGPTTRATATTPTSCSSIGVAFDNQLNFGWLAASTTSSPQDEHEPFDLVGYPGNPWASSSPATPPARRPSA